MSLFVFICAAICSVTTADTIPASGYDAAEQEERPEGDDSVGDLLNRVKKSEEELKKLLDTINSALKAHSIESLNYSKISALKDIVLAVINQDREVLDEATEKMDSLGLTLDEVEMAFAQMEDYLEHAIVDGGEKNEKPSSGDA